MRYTQSFTKTVVSRGLEDLPDMDPIAGQELLPARTLPDKPPSFAAPKFDFKEPPNRAGMARQRRSRKRLNMNIFTQGKEILITHLI